MPGAAVTIAYDDAMSGLFSQLEVLSVRVEEARAGAEARARAIETARPPTPSPPPVPPGRARGPGRRRPSRRGLVLALVLVLLGAGVTAIVAAGRGERTRTPDSTSVTDGTVALDRPAPAVTGVPGTASVSPVAPGPAPAVVAPPSAIPAPEVVAASPPSGVAVTDPATSVAVETGDSFWSIAEHRVASVRGTTPTTAEVAGYWAQLVEVNRGRLAHAGNPDVIYAGQAFLLP